MRRAARSACANRCSFSRPATSFETTRSSGSRQTAWLAPAPGSTKTTSRSCQPAGALLVAILEWSGASGRELLLDDAGWAVLAGLVVGALVTPGVRRLPSGPRASGGRLLPMLAYEGVVYGIAEAILLATLPVLAAWFAFSDLGWTDEGWQRIGAGALAIVAALVVILVHHLGYEEARRCSPACCSDAGCRRSRSC